MYNASMVDLTQYKKREIKAIRQGEPGFMLNDGMIMYPRAMVHILPECPPNTRQIINWAIENGYLKTVAHVQGKELTWESLTE
jgi:hypothetical protein